jgi:hypothetical protein
MMERRSHFRDRHRTIWVARAPVARIAHEDVWQRGGHALTLWAGAHEGFAGTTGRVHEFLGRISGPNFWAEFLGRISGPDFWALAYAAVNLTTPS